MPFRRIGIRWKVSPNPVISETGHADDWKRVSWLAKPGAIVRGDEIFVYFSAVGARRTGNPPQDQSIGLATTQDGEHFAPPPKGSSCNRLSILLKKGFAGYSTPQPFEFNGKVHLVYDVALYQKTANPDWQQVALHHAVSQSDGRGDFRSRWRADFLRGTTFHGLWVKLSGPRHSLMVDRSRSGLGGHVPVSELGPLIRRDFSGVEFGVNYAEKSVADFQQ